jgi:hypothetical protein
MAESLCERAAGWMTGVLFSDGQEIFSFAQRPDWLRGPSNLLCNGYGGIAAGP